MDKARALGNLGKKNILNDEKFVKKVTKEEEKYSKYLDDFDASPVETPLDILAEGMGPNVKPGFKDVDDAVNRQFLIMNEAHKAVMGKRREAADKQTTTTTRISTSTTAFRSSRTRTPNDFWR